MSLPTRDQLLDNKCISPAPHWTIVRASAGNKPPILRTRQQSTARKSSSYFQPGKKISFTMQYFTFLNESISVQIILAAIETGDERPF